MFHTSLSNQDRNNLIKDFNTNRDSTMVLVCSYSVNSAGMNLQGMCRNVHLFDTTSAESATAQAIGRVYRLSQVRMVRIYEYKVPDSFNIKQINRNIKKAIPGLVAELSSAIFHVNHSDEG